MPFGERKDFPLNLQLNPHCQISNFEFYFDKFTLVHDDLQGVLRMGQEIEIRPGIVTKAATGAIKCIPIYSRIVSHQLSYFP